MVNVIKKQVKYLGRLIYFFAAATDDGVNILIAGGDRSHIGAVAIADPAGKCSVTTFPGHKETEIAKKWAHAFYAKYQKPVVVSAGIHYDGIGKEEIMDIVRITDELLDEFLNLYGEQNEENRCDRDTGF